MTGTVTPAALAETHAAAFVIDRAWGPDEFADLLVQDTVLIGDAACFILGRVVADEAEVLTLATHPDHQRLGLAQAQLATFHHAAAANGAKTVFLEVAADNAAAIALYQQAGYAQAGKRPRYYVRPHHHTVDALIMRRDLSDEPIA